MCSIKISPLFLVCAAVFNVSFPASSGARFPPIKTNSAGSGQKRERISFRDNEVKLGIGWGGGRKRGQRM